MSNESILYVVFSREFLTPEDIHFFTRSIMLDTVAGIEQTLGRQCKRHGTEKPQLAPDEFCVQLELN